MTKEELVNFQWPGVGGRHRVQHCGASKSMLLRRDGPFGTAKCFRCGEYGRILLTSTPADLLKPQPKLEQVFAPALSQDYSTGHLVWLAKAGLVPSDIPGLYITQSGDLAIPGRGGVLVRLFREGPKYLRDRRGMVVEYGQPDEEHGILYVVEDPLSAMRLALAGGHAVALLGTHMEPAVEARILEIHPRKLICWADPDPHGLHAMRKVAKTFGHTLTYVSIRSIGQEAKHLSWQDLGVETHKDTQ